MNIIAKSSIDKNQIYERLKYGTNKIELQLMKDYLLDETKNFDIFNEVIETGCEIVTIHMPLIEKGEELNLEYFTYSNYSEIFFKACELAEMFANKFNYKILIVIHNGFSLESYKKMPKLFIEIEKIFKHIITEFKNIIFSFENVCPMVEKKDRIFTRNGFLFDNVDLANYFNSLFNTNIFGTTIDTCHILTTMEVLKYFEKSDTFNIKDISLEKYFFMNKDTVNNIHLCNLTNKGLNKLEHGSAFDLNNEKDIQFIREFVRLYRKYNIEAYVTIEVAEKDYLNCINLDKTINCLKYVINNF